MIRIIGCALLIFLSFFLQTSVLVDIPFIQSTPNLMLILTLSFAIIRGREEGLIIGVICGLLMDIASGGFIGFFGLFYMYLGFICGLFYQHINEDVPLVPAGFIVLAELLYHMYVFIFKFLLRGRLGLGVYFNDIILPELFVTTILSLFVYGLLLFLNNKLEAYEKRSALKFA